MAIYLTLALTFFNFVGVNAVRIVLTLYALELGAPPSTVGLLGGMFYLFPLLLSWPIGSLADRYGSRWLLLAGTLCGVGAALLPYFVRDIKAFYVAAALSGLGLAFFHVTLQNLMGILSKPSERARNFSNFSLVGATTNFVGPLFAGFTIDTSGFAIACLHTAVLSLISAAMLLIWGRMLPGGSGQASGGTGTLKTLKDREVVRMLGISGLVQLGTDLFQFYIPIYGHAIQLSASAIGAVLASFAGASFVVRIFMPRMLQTIAPERLLAWSFYAGAFGFVLVPFFESALLLGVVAFVFGLGMGVGTPLTVIMMFSRSSEGRSGQTLGLRLTANNLVRVLGPMVFGAIGSAFGVPSVFWINAVMMGSGGLLSRTGKAGKA
jgi:MFS family permease